VAGAGGCGEEGFGGGPMNILLIVGASLFMVVVRPVEEA